MDNVVLPSLRFTSIIMKYKCVEEELFEGKVSLSFSFM